ncbi:hypothetical protein BCD67_02440 [Oscillatoriales cyanobacterium USR001]|nr:hypothetical protein BCD67_02440 [Oscillatoriales cyanobacterium USR001]
MIFKHIKSHPLIWIIATTAIIFMICSSIRHYLFQSTAFEMGIYDQVAYLISQGETPFSSFLGIHHLGNHAALAMYPLALLYKIYPSVYWLLLIQAISLTLGAWPTWSLARQAGLNESKSLAMALMYLFYPVIFNINLFDFHPEVMAIPALLGAILAAKLDKILWFTIAIIWVLACKDALSLTVAAMGIWLFFFEKKRLCGAIALTFGVGWFIIVTQGIIPHFKGGKGPGGVGRYGYLGDSVFEIAINIILKPGLVLGRIFSWETLQYLGLLLLPIIWWLSPRHLAPLIGALPVLVKNILSDIDAQRDLIHQYSLPLLPFLLLAVIATLVDREKIGQNPIKLPITNYQLPKFIITKFIIIWSLVTFLALAKYGYFWTIYLDSLDTWQATKNAITLVKTSGNVLTTANIAPHLSHRKVINLTNVNAAPKNLADFDYVLLNIRHPGWNSNQEFANSLVNQLKNNPEFKLSYDRDGVYLFNRNNK